ncbi:MAG: GGDEF domain-containing protein [Pseudomonadota bacterium]
MRSYADASVLLDALDRPGWLADRSGVVATNAALRHVLYPAVAATACQALFEQIFPDASDAPEDVFEHALGLEQKTLSLARPNGGPADLVMKKLPVSEDTVLFVLRDDDTARQVADATAQLDVLRRSLAAMSLDLTIKSAAGREYLFINRNSLHDVAVDSNSAIGKTVHQLVPPDIAHQLSAEDDRVLASASGRMTRVYASTRGHYRGHKQVVFDANGVPELILSTVENVSSSERSRLERERNTADLARAENIARVGSYRCHPAGSRLFMSAFLRQMFEFDDKSIAVNLKEFLSRLEPRYRERVMIAHERLRQGKSVEKQNMRYTNSAGDTLHLELRCEMARESENAPFSIHGTVHDVTDRVKTEEKVRFMAYHDGLTKLPNRSFFLRRATQAMGLATAGGRPFALHLIDLDGFKAINDSRGHQAGDQVLQVVAKRIQTTIKNSDLGARFGGDEFAVLQLDVSCDADATALSQRLIERISAEMMIDGQSTLVGASVGVAIFNPEEVDLQVMMQRADEVLYVAKRAGRGTYRLAS